MDKEENYEPYGKEWENHIYKNIPKKDLIHMFRKSLLRNRKLEGLIEGIYKIRDLWLPSKDVEPEHSSEAQALSKMDSDIKELLNREDQKEG